MASFASYSVGSKFTVNGVLWTITAVSTRESKTGRSVRVFSVTDGTRTIQKTSRGLTFWINGGEEAEEEGDEPQPATGGNLAAILADTIGPYLESVMDEGAIGTIVDERIAAAVANVAVNPDTIQRIVDERIAATLPVRVEVKRQDGTMQDMGVQHTMFPSLLKAVAARCNVWLVGPAGTGKTTAAKNVAEALGLPFYAKSIGPHTTEGGLLGYMHGGEYVRTALRNAYENGGVMLLDECDSAAAGLVVANAVAANDKAGFPDAVVKRHTNFVLLAGANTVGMGADRQYVSRQQIDAATLDRFVFLPWDNDPVLEAAACGVPLSAWEGLPRIPAPKFHDEDGTADRCVEFVQRTTRVRLALQKLGTGVRMIVANRTNQHGVALLRQGWTVNDAMEACVWKGCPADQRAKVEAHC